MLSKVRITQIVNKMAGINEKEWNFTNIKHKATKTTQEA
jgi:hypothetical protein